MAPDDLVATLTTACPPPLAESLVKEFMQVRRDVATGTLGRAAPGKFIETLVQIFQHLENGAHEAKPDVDEYLRRLESRTGLDDGLRLCAARVGRAMYTVRNKRAIAHIGAVDPNSYDLRFLLHGAQWIVAELLRVASKVTMAEAGRLIEQIHEPVGSLIDDYGDRPLVLAKFPARDELIILLHRSYPDAVALTDVLKSLDRRRPRVVKDTIRKLWNEKIVDGGGKTGYRLTQRGHDTAIEIIRTATR